MKNQSFEDKAQALDNLMKHTCQQYLLVIKGEVHTAVTMRGSVPDLLFMAHSICESIHDKLEETFSKEMADEFIKSVIMTEEEIHEKNKQMLADMDKKEIPSWLKKLMDIEEDLMDEDDDDSTDEADGEEEDEQDDDEGDSPDFTVRVDIHHHDGDDDNE